MDDRIKLAEAMGWTDFIGEVGLPPGAKDARPVTQGHQLPPDPFTDANDDYAVLEWIRNQVGEEHGWLPSGKARWSSSDEWWPFYEQFGNVTAASYKIGDYARAALKVLE